MDVVDHLTDSDKELIGVVFGKYYDERVAARIADIESKDFDTLEELLAGWQEIYEQYDPELIYGFVLVDFAISKYGLAQITDEEAIAVLVETVWPRCTTAIADLLAGKKKAINSIVDEVIMESNGKANPRIVSQLIRQRLQQ